MKNWLCLLFLSCVAQLNAFDLNRVRQDPDPYHPSRPYTVERFVNAHQINPFECVDTSPLIAKQAFDDCKFNVHWDPTKRLVFSEDVQPTTVATTTVPRLVRHNMRVVPMPCSAERCVFSKLKMIEPDDRVNRAAFEAFLDGFYQKHPAWNMTRTPIINECLDQNLVNNNGHCEINKLLACVFDVLSEHCPSRSGQDECKHPPRSKKGHTKPLLCQVNASPHKPANRRTFCVTPELVSEDEVQECGIKSLSHIEMVNEYEDEEPTRKPAAVVKPGILRESRPLLCKPLNSATVCVLKKLNMTSKYGFLDHIKLRKAIEALPYQTTEILRAYDSIPHYREHCTSEKKLLNLIDAMIRFAPERKRKNTASCLHFRNGIMIRDGRFIYDRPLLVAPIRPDYKSYRFNLPRPYFDRDHFEFPNINLEPVIVEENRFL